MEQHVATTDALRWTLLFVVSVLLHDCCNLLDDEMMIILLYISPCMYK
jgi:hypothetical protein